MKKSIRKRLVAGVVFLFLIILLLTVLSSYYFTILSSKTGAILSENVASVTYAREMSEKLKDINLQLTNYLLINKKYDNSKINNDLLSFRTSIQKEKNNITEIGEAQVASAIEKKFNEYSDSLKSFLISPKKITQAYFFQNQFEIISNQLSVLSQINEKAIEKKTNEARVSAKKALTHMSFISTICFLIAAGFAFSFATFFSDKILQLYNGVIELSSSNYEKKLDFEDNDEFYEISIILNKMAEKLNRINTMKISN